MEEHQQHHHPIIQQYGITDLRHLIDPPLQLQSQPSFETVMMMNRPISAAEITPSHHHHQTHYGLTAAPTSSLSGGGGFEVAGDAGTGRWPRQETLTLLEIRSRLDSKFKDANQKGPLWDEVSRVMSEEHGYQRSGKKCREKFENLYKYYKKTKEGKAGRQDGKHYRFFRQLEALYGETSNNNNNIINNNSNPNDMNDNQVSHNYNSLGLFHAIPTPREASNNNIDNDSSESFDSSYSSDDNAAKRRPRGWKAKIKEFVDSHMKKLMERQEAWLEKLMRTLEQKERERGLREEEWRREEASRVEREHRFWAKERAWIEARDSALMEALKSLNPRKSGPNDQEEEEEEAEVGLSSRPELGFLNLNWTELEISRLIELRTGIESRFDGGEDLWDDVASKMACLGHDRSGSACREKWESINSSSNNNSDRNSKKRKENGNYNNFLNNVNNNESSTSLYNHGGYENCDHMNDGTSSSPSNANVGHSMNSHDHHHNHHHNHNHVVGHDGCFPFFMGEGSENLWESYGVKINKGGQNI